jgi:hypothetical protein
MFEIRETCTRIGQPRQVKRFGERSHTASYKSRPWHFGNRRRFARRRPCLFIEVLRQGSDIDLLGDLDCVIDLNAKIANGTFNFGMAEQNLNRSEVPGSPIDQDCLRPAQGVRTELGRVGADAGHPLLDESCVLPRGQAALLIAATGEQELPGLSTGQPQVFVDGLSGLVR